MSEDLETKDLLEARLAEVDEEKRSHALEYILTGFVAGSLSVLMVQKLGEK